MKRFIKILSVVSIVIFFSINVIAENKTEQSAMAKTLKLKSLQLKKEKLQQEIKVQDGKRNKQISGVSAEVMEDINDKQDSICLGLRSELVTVLLEIKENSPKNVTPILLEQYNELVKQNKNSSAGE